MSGTSAVYKIGDIRKATKAVETYCNIKDLGKGLCSLANNALLTHENITNHFIDIVGSEAGKIADNICEMIRIAQITSYNKYDKIVGLIVDSDLSTEKKIDAVMQLREADNKHLNTTIMVGGMTIGFCLVLAGGVVFVPVVLKSGTILKLGEMALEVKDKFALKAFVAFMKNLNIKL